MAASEPGTAEAVKEQASQGELEFEAEAHPARPSLELEAQAARRQARLGAEAALLLATEAPLARDALREFREEQAADCVPLLSAL